MMIIPPSFIITGVLTDQVFEPGVGQAGWDRVAPLVGSETGSGMGLLILISGGLMLLLTLAVYAHPKVRSMEADLPDFDQQTSEPVLPEKPESQPILPEGAIPA